MLFESLTPQLVRDGLAQAREQNRRNREAAYETLWDFYEGGSSIEQYLIKKPGETGAEFRDRVLRIEYPNYVRRIVDELLRDAYGFDVERKLAPPATDAHNVTFDDAEMRSGWDVEARKYAQSMLVLGDGWANVAWREQEQRVAVFSVHPANVWAAWDPDNPTKISRLLEERVDYAAPLYNGKPPSYFWIWTPDEFTYTDADGRPIPVNGEEGPWVNPYGVIPYVHFAARPSIGEQYGTSYIRDLVTSQNVVLNRLSEHDVLVGDQAHGTLVLSGVDIPEVQSGPKRAVNVGLGGDAKFIQPGADVAAVINSIDRTVERMFETASVPLSVVKGGSASSGLALAIEMRPLTSLVEEIRATATHYEKELIRVFCAVASKHGIALPVGDACVPEVKFPNAVLPSDKTEEFRRDFSMVTAIPPLMTREAFVKKWQGLDDQGALDEYMAKLDAEAALAMGSSSSSGNGGTAGEDGGTGYNPMGGGQAGAGLDGKGPLHYSDGSLGGDIGQP